MTQPNARPRILVGDLVRVARPTGGGPVNHEGHTGRVIDALGDGSAFLVAYAGSLGREGWVDARYLVTVDLAYLARRLAVPEPAHVAEPEGHDDHLDAIEAGLVSVPLTATRTEGAIGSVVVTSRVAFVPKGGAR